MCRKWQRNTNYKATKKRKALLHDNIHSRWLITYRSDNSQVRCLSRIYTRGHSILHWESSHSCNENSLGLKHGPSTHLCLIIKTHLLPMESYKQVAPTLFFFFTVCGCFTCTSATCTPVLIQAVWPASVHAMGHHVLYRYAKGLGNHRQWHTEQDRHGFCLWGVSGSE